MWFGVVFWGEARVVTGMFRVGLFSWMVVIGFGLSRTLTLLILQPHISQDGLCKEFNGSPGRWRTVRAPLFSISRGHTFVPRMKMCGKCIVQLKVCAITKIIYRSKSE